MSFKSITTKATQELQKRVQGKWFNADGTPKPNYIFKIADNTPKGDAGEQIVGEIFNQIYTELYPNSVVTVDVVGADKGDYDLIVLVVEPGSRVSNGHRDIDFEGVQFGWSPLGGDACRHRAFRLHASELSEALVWLAKPVRCGGGGGSVDRGRWVACSGDGCTR